MSTKRFVSGSSILLVGWLGATFLNEVPAQRYPKLDKKAAATEPADPLKAPQTVEAPEATASR